MPAPYPGGAATWLPATDAAITTSSLASSRESRNVDAGNGRAEAVDGADDGPRTTGGTDVIQGAPDSTQAGYA